MIHVYTSLYVCLPETMLWEPVQTASEPPQRFLKTDFCYRLNYVPQTINVKVLILLSQYDLIWK